MKNVAKVKFNYVSVISIKGIVLIKFIFTLQWQLIKEKAFWKIKDKFQLGISSSNEVHC